MEERESGVASPGRGIKDSGWPGPGPGWDADHCRYEGKDIEVQNADTWCIATKNEGYKLLQICG